MRKTNTAAPSIPAIGNGGSRDMGGFLCVKCPGACRSPVACGAFGYCRERNFDGYPVDERGIARRRAESDAVYAEQRK
jgi:hypothetical protein